MRILFAGDEHPYSAFALNEVIRLAMNTWADVTLLAVLPSLPGEESAGARPLTSDQPLSEPFRAYRETFLKAWSDEDSPYAMKNWGYELIPLKRGVWEEMMVCRGTKRDLKVRVRVGNVAHEILAEAREEESDLIVLGCTRGDRCVWEGGLPVPQNVVNDADCSVLLVKEEQSINRLLACLDQSYISQDSLEMLNQMATIHGARMELVGLSQEGGMKKEVYRRLIEIGDYYEDRRINLTTRLTEVSDFESFIGSEVKQDLLALWMGKKSLLDRFFPRDWVGRFVSKCQTSVLVMR
jgi:hypothetical protein